MKVNAALCLVLAASAILLESCRLTLVRRNLAQLCAGLVILVTALTLLEYLSGWTFEIDELFMADRTPPVLVAAPGRMAVTTATGLLLLGCALLMGNRRRGLFWKQFLTVGVAVLCLSNLVGYLYGIENFTGIAFYTAMPVHTSSSLLILSLAMLFSRPDRGLMSLVTNENLAGIAVRRLLPAAVLVPVFLGWLTRQAELHRVHGPVFGLAVFATANVVVFSYLIWTGGRRLNLMETEKHEAEESFRLAVEAAPSGMVMSDRDGRITLMNSRAEKQFGYRRQELLGESIEILVPEASRQIHVDSRGEFFVRPLARLMGFGREVNARRKDGKQFPVEIGLNPIETENGTWVLSSILDITEKRRAEEERQKFVSLVDRSLEFVGMCDLDFRPFYVNAAGLRLVGLDNLEAARRIKVQDYFFPEDQPFVTNEFFPRVLSEGHGKVEIRFRHFKTGDAIWMLYNVFSICDTHGAPVGWATVSVDITERRQAERALQESRQELRALAGRLINAEEEARKTISRELHDDLSQKLALLAFDTGSLVLAPPPTVEEIKEPLRNLQTRVVQLAQDVRQISHQLHPTILEDLGLTAALTELCDEFSAREGIDVVFEEEAVPKALPVDMASCLYRVVQEALHNVSKHAQASHVRLKLSGGPEGIHLSIHDTGVGFDSKGGPSPHGLGIVSMKERVELVHGEFSIHSQPGRGTEVRIFVPLSKEA